MTIITGLAAMAALVLALPLLTDLLALLASRQRPLSAPSQEPARFIALVPAHDEQTLIASCVDSLRSASPGAGRLDVIVIADNCTDATAAIARQHGATVLERRDPRRRGKPHAIAWALTQLSTVDTDAVVIIDADTIVDRSFFQELSRLQPLRDIVVQAHYASRNRDDNDLTWLASLFGDVRYYFAFPLKNRAGLNVPLMGNGMSIGVEILRKFGWNAFSITENWELYAQYVARGVPIRVAADAVLFAEEARTLAQSRTQRQRWAAGKIGVLMEYGGPILRSRRIGMLQKVDAIGELAAPGPVAHLGLALMLQMILLPFWGPAVVATSLLLWAPIFRYVVYTGLALRRCGEIGRFLRALRQVPFYLLWRVRLQFAALRMIRSSDWIRTQRN